MKPIDPDKTEVALGLRRIDVRMIYPTFTFSPALDLRLQKAYWLQTIQPHIAGRKLCGAELCIAADAHCWLRGMADGARRWNETEEGKKSPIPEDAFPEFEKAEFHEPEELVADESVRPEILAGIAATLVKTEKKLSIGEAVRTAHELLTAAQRYVGTLPKPIQRNDPRAYLNAYYEKRFSKITFEEILKSNEKKSGQLPLLPPVQQGRNDGSLTMAALKAAVKRFLQPLSISEVDYEREEDEREIGIKKNVEKFGSGFSYIEGKRLTYQEWQKQNQDSINDCLQNNRISLHLLTTLRWERFKKFWLKQQERAQKNKAG